MNKIRLKADGMYTETEIGRNRKEKKILFTIQPIQFSFSKPSIKYEFELKMNTYSEYIDVFPKKASCIWRFPMNRVWMINHHELLTECGFCLLMILNTCKVQAFDIASACPSPCLPYVDLYFFVLWKLYYLNFMYYVVFQT